MTLDEAIRAAADELRGCCDHDDFISRGDLVERAITEFIRPLFDQLQQQLTNATQRAAIYEAMVEQLPELQQRAENAEAAAAAMRKTLLMAIQNPIPYKVMWHRVPHVEPSTCVGCQLEAALSVTAGQALLGELQRLRAIVKRVDACCVSALPNDPEGPSSVEHLGAMNMAVDVLAIVRDQTSSEVSK